MEAITGLFAVALIAVVVWLAVLALLLPYFVWKMHGHLARLVLIAEAAYPAQRAAEAAAYHAYLQGPPPPAGPGRLD